MMCHVADAGMQSHNFWMLVLILNPFNTSQLSAPLIIIQFMLGGKLKIKLHNNQLINHQIGLTQRDKVADHKTG